MSLNAEQIFRKYNSTSDEDWKEIIRKSATNPLVDGIAFPLVPDEATQRHYVGSTLEKNVHEPYQYYKAIKETYESRIRDIDERTKLLDVGSGWGRIIRFFMKDIVPPNLRGCDVDSRSVDICNVCFRGELNFQLIKTLPPTPYEDDCFDIVEGYSIFTHLSYYALSLWMHEYFRILKPGGLLAMTVWQPRRFDYIRQLQSEPPKSRESEDYQHMLQTSFSPNCELEEAFYKEAGVVYIPYSSNPDVTYGEAFISPHVLSQNWNFIFEPVMTFKLDVDQQVVFLRKKPDAPEIDTEILQDIGRFAKMYDLQSICIHDYKMKKMQALKSSFQDRLDDQERLIKEIEEQLAEKTRCVESLLGSASWRVTAPFRCLHEAMLKLREKR